MPEHCGDDATEGEVLLRYAAARWLNIRRWLDANPDDELAGQMRGEPSLAPARHARYRREYLGWGVFVLMER